MWRYIFWNTLTYLLALFVLTFIIYLLYVSVNPNPLRGQYEGYATRNDLIGYNALLEREGLTAPAVERFGLWIKGVFSGDWGRIYNASSFISPNITDVFFKPLGTSMRVTLPSYFFGMIIGTPLGIIAAYQFASRKRSGRFWDSTISFFVQLFSAIPSFVWATFAVLIGPLVGLFVGYEENAGTAILVESLILPNIVITLVSIAFWTIRLRIEIVNVLFSDFILAARSRGFSRSTIFFKYVLRNSLYPYVSEVTGAFLLIFGSSVVTETYFNVPGISTPLVRASKLGEINILMFNVFFFGLIGAGLSVFGLAMQLSIDPRTKLQFSSEWRGWIYLKAKWQRKQVVSKVSVGKEQT